LIFFSFREKEHDEIMNRYVLFVLWFDSSLLINIFERVLWIPYRFLYVSRSLFRNLFDQIL
jgi:hypothetical protein